MIQAETRALHDYWEGLRRGRSTPFRSEVDPREMVCNVRNLFILEDLGNRNLRFRLAGTEIVDSLDLELRGMSVRSIMDDPARESFVEIISESLAEPGIGYLRLVRADSATERWEMLLLPLRSDNGRVDRVLGCLHCLEAVDRIGPSTPLRFAIDQAKITPVMITEPDEPSPSLGFSEAKAPFRLAGGNIDNPQALIAIQGGLDDSENPAIEPKQSDRPHLRLVKDE